MKLQLIAVGNKMPAWVQEGVLTYLRRFPKELPLEIMEIPAVKRQKNANIKRILEKEGEMMLAAISKSSQIITLDIPGQPWTTEKLAQQLENWQQNGQDVSLMIGGPEGLAPAVKAVATQSWSLSPLTLPHPLARIVVVESLYRAWSIITHHPYHRE